MCNLGKICISLLNNSKLKTTDFTDNTGFAGFYTEDVDKPYLGKSIFLVYDATINNDSTKDMYKRIESDINKKRFYTKIINNKPYYIYEYYVNPDIKNILNNTVYLKPEHKVRVLQFWGPYDSVSSTVLSNNILGYDTSIVIPPQDYIETVEDYLTKNISLTV